MWGTGEQGSGSEGAEDPRLSAGLALLQVAGEGLSSPLGAEVGHGQLRRGSLPLRPRATRSPAVLALSSILCGPCGKGAVLIAWRREPGSPKPGLLGRSPPRLCTGLSLPPRGLGVALELSNCRHPNLCSWLEQMESFVRGQPGAGACTKPLIHSHPFLSLVKVVCNFIVATGHMVPTCETPRGPPPKGLMT